MNRCPIASSDADMKENENAYLGSEGRIIFNLYKFCQDSLSIILSKKISEDLLSHDWEELRAMLYIWENEFSVLDSELDQLFIKTGYKHLQEATCIALGSLAWSLSEYLTDSQWPHREVMAGITEVMVSLMPALADIFRPQEASDEWPVDGGDIIDELVRNVKSGVRYLYNFLLLLVDLFQRHYNN
ncbi:hypothetical protein B9Z19DRAFT_1189889 [Tuber borchii]|uniref:Uncharacterized protein n=1 Tax=Tuber borchii TaxID=42251 RepID=A0A2T7A5T4_TUBBO|nr:hypothetical protein B9Z19DRAFT_1189889 [Tuber borchii]